MKFCSWPNSQATAIALFPFRNPITEATGYFGGIAMHMCTSSGFRCPSIIRHSFVGRGHGQFPPADGGHFANERTGQAASRLEWIDTAVFGRSPALNISRPITINMPSPEGGITNGLDVPSGQYISNVVYAATSSIVVGDTIQSRDCRGRLP